MVIVFWSFDPKRYLRRCTAPFGGDPGRTQIKMSPRYPVDAMRPISSTSCLKTKDGHRYPCPAQVFLNGSCYVSRAAAPEGTCGDEVLWNSGNLSVRLSLRLSVPPPPSPRPLRGWPRPLRGGTRHLRGWPRPLRGWPRPLRG